MTYYRPNSKTVLYGGRVLLYQLTSTTNNNWYARIKLIGHSKYIIKSLKTSSKSVALGDVEVLYQTLLYRSKLGISIKEVNWDTVFAELIVYRRKIYEPTSMKGHRYTDLLIKKNEMYFSPFFMDSDNCHSFAHIDNTTLHRWVDWRIKQSSNSNEYRTSNCSWATLNQELTKLRLVLRFANSKGYLNTLPMFKNPIPKPPRYARSRAKMDKTIYQILMKATLHEQTNARQKKTRIQSHILRLAIKFIASTGIRVRELKRLKYRDISLREDDEGNSFTVVHIRPDVSKQREERYAVAYDGANLWHMILRYKESMNQLTDKPKTSNNSFVFAKCYGDDEESITDITMLYGGLVNRWNSRENPKYIIPRRDDRDRPLTLTSLRHMFANQQISSGTPIAIIAEQMGTSIAVISETYSEQASWRNRLQLTSPGYRARVFNNSLVE